MRRWFERLCQLSPGLKLRDQEHSGQVILGDFNDTIPKGRAAQFTLQLTLHCNCLDAALGGGSTVTLLSWACRRVPGVLPSPIPALIKAVAVVAH
jgi:hypothetical protein